MLERAGSQWYCWLLSLNGENLTPDHVTSGALNLWPELRLWLAVFQILCPLEPAGTH